MGAEPPRHPALLLPSRRTFWQVEGGRTRARVPALSPHRVLGSICATRRGGWLGSDIHVMLALCCRSRQVVMANEELNGPDMVGELLGKRQRCAYQPRNALSQRVVEPFDVKPASRRRARSGSASGGQPVRYARSSPRSLSHASSSGFVGYRKVIVEDPSIRPITPPGFRTRRISVSAARGAARCCRTAHAKAVSNEPSGKGS